MFAALKRERGRRAGKGEKETDLKLEKTFQSLWTPCRTCSKQVAYTVKSTAMKVQFASGAKNKFVAFPRKEPNMEKLRDKLGEISGMELSSF